jgi:hypothetical protein
MRGMRLADGLSRAVPDPIAPMPIRPLSALTALLHVYIALRLLPALAVLTPAWPLALVALAVSALHHSAAFRLAQHRAATPRWAPC